MSEPRYHTGISVVLCCYNSASRLKNTLNALAMQEFPAEQAAELILVDNASKDDTTIVAQNIWAEKNHPFPLRIVQESKQGLVYAREKGIAAAKYKYIVFCDDDNWLNPNYIARMYNVLSKNEKIAACGGRGIPVFDGEKPIWFDEYAEAFATGPQPVDPITGKIISLYGAGLGLNMDAFEDLQKSGFMQLLHGRLGNTLSSAEDIELTYAFVLRGYELKFDDALQFFHWLPASRLQWSYLKKLFSAFGTDGPVRNIYYGAITKRSVHRRLKSWPLHLMFALFRMAKYVVRPPKKLGRALYFSWSISYIKSLLHLQPGYRKMVEQINSIQPSSGFTSHNVRMRSQRQLQETE